MSKTKNQSKQSTNIVNEEDRVCIICGKPAICTEKGCWRIRKDIAECNTCPERYCTKHWRRKVAKM